MGISDQISKNILEKTDFANEAVELATARVINASAALTRAGIVFETAANAVEVAECEAITGMAAEFVYFATKATKPEMAKEDREEMGYLFLVFFRSIIPDMTGAGVALFKRSFEMKSAIDALNTLQNEV